MALGGVVASNDETSVSSRWDEAGLTERPESEQERWSSFLLPSWDDVGLNEVIIAPTKLPTDPSNELLPLFLFWFLVTFTTAAVVSEIR